MKLVNKRNGLELHVCTLPKQKRPSLIIVDQLGAEKVATFLGDEGAADFIHHLEQLLEERVKRVNE